MKTGVFVDQKNYQAEALNFQYDSQEWSVEFLGYEGFGDTSEEALEDLINSIESDERKLVRYNNGFVLEEVE